MKIYQIILLILLLNPFNKLNSCEKIRNCLKTLFCCGCCRKKTPQYLETTQTNLQDEDYQVQTNLNTINSTQIHQLTESELIENEFTRLQKIGKEIMAQEISKYQPNLSTNITNLINLQKKCTKYTTLNDQIDEEIDLEQDALQKYFEWQSVQPILLSPTQSTGSQENSINSIKSLGGSKDYRRFAFAPMSMNTNSSLSESDYASI